MRRSFACIVFCMAFVWSASASAGPKGSVEGEPKRSYGAVDVVMYQTSW